MGKKNKSGSKKDKFQFVEMDEKNLEVTKTLSLEDIQKAIKKEKYRKNAYKKKSSSTKKTPSVETEEGKEEVVVDPITEVKLEEPVEVKEDPIEEVHLEENLPIEVEKIKEEVNEVVEEVSSEEEKVEEPVPEEPPVEIEEKKEEIPEDDIFAEAILNKETPKKVEITPVEKIAAEANIPESEPVVSEEERVARLKKKLHFSFEARVTIMVVCILLLFLGACLLIIETIRSGKNEVVYYDEVSNTSYSVCLFPNETYHQECLEEDMEYLSELTNTIGVYFQYNVKLSTDISYDLAYHISAITKIYDASDSSKVLYRTEEILVDKTNFDNVDSQISIDTDVTLDYQNYNRIVRDYQARYALNSAAEVEAILYLDEATETRKIASIIIPLGQDTYHIQKDIITNKNQKVEIDGDFWNRYNTTCAIIASILILISLFLLYQTARLVLKVTTNHNKYQQKLSQILRDYDRIIVIARNGYESNVERQVVKVESFEELLDAQETLQKPIIYSRINDVKSEFIVEDEETLYKYVLKESNL